MASQTSVTRPRDVTASFVVAKRRVGRGSARLALLLDRVHDRHRPHTRAANRPAVLLASVRPVGVGVLKFAVPERRGVLRFPTQARAQDEQRRDDD